ncbi:MAG: hypothetical protein J6L85_07805 [Clostridia bacterium]|nr:hypothetical protein [Clostridia bacterium]
MYNFKFSRLTHLFLIYGLYAVLCHAVGILFCAISELGAPPGLMFHIIFPLLEHSLMSFVLVLFGALGIEYVCMSQAN